jgi:hypothetical protein
MNWKMPVVFIHWPNKTHNRMWSDRKLFEISEVTRALATGMVRMSDGRWMQMQLQ